MVQVGPQWSQWILKWPQTVPESPRQSFKFQKSSQVLPFSYQLFISTARCSRRSSVSKISDNLLLILKIPSNPTVQIECSKWSKWVLNGFIGSSNGPRQSQRVPDSSKFQKSFQFRPFFQDEDRLFISTVRCSYNSSVSKFYHNLLLILGRVRF